MYWKRATPVINNYEWTKGGGSASLPREPQPAYIGRRQLWGDGASAEGSQGGTELQVFYANAHVLGARKVVQVTEAVCEGGYDLGMFVELGWDKYDIPGYKLYSLPYQGQGQGLGRG